VREGEQQSRDELLDKTAEPGIASWSDSKGCCVGTCRMSAFGLFCFVQPPVVV
jgi:hypothetical protein